MSVCALAGVAVVALSSGCGLVLDAGPRSLGLDAAVGDAGIRPAMDAGGGVDPDRDGAAQTGARRDGEVEDRDGGAAARDSGGPDAAPMARDAGPAGADCELTCDLSTSYCAYPRGCLGEPMCTPRPPAGTACPPGRVCGCDGQTYETTCEAAQAGVSVRHESSCGDASWCPISPPERVGLCQPCFDDADCATDERCLGASCALRLAGRCLPGVRLLPVRGCYVLEDCGSGQRCFGAEVGSCTSGALTVIGRCM